MVKNYQNNLAFLMEQLIFLISKDSEMYYLVLVRFSIAFILEVFQLLSNLTALKVSKLGLETPVTSWKKVDFRLYVCTFRSCKIEFYFTKEYMVLIMHGHEYTFSEAGPENFSFLSVLDSDSHLESMLHYRRTYDWNSNFNNVKTPC